MNTKEFGRKRPCFSRFINLLLSKIVCEKSPNSHNQRCLSRDSNRKPSE